MMVKLGIMTYSGRGLEKLHKNQSPRVGIAYHPTLIDVVVLIGMMQQASIVS